MIWAGLQYSDWLGAAPKDMTIDGEAREGFSARLSITKTNGPGKAIKEVFFYVGITAYVTEQLWLELGFGLWESLSATVAMEDRDLILLKPNDSWN
eukprot:5049474-Amphidinium_carterae.2